MNERPGGKSESAQVIEGAVPGARKVRAEVRVSGCMGVPVSRDRVGIGARAMGFLTTKEMGCEIEAELRGLPMVKGMV